MKQSNLAMNEPPASLDDRMSLFSKSGDDVFNKAYELSAVDMLQQMNLYPYFLPIDRNEGPLAIIDDKEVVMLGSNNYLGLTIHPEVRSAAMKAINDFGTSLTGSRLLNGTHKLHAALEEDLAAFLNKPSCLVFTTGYQANLGVLSALMTADSVLVIDKADHASIYDGARLCKAKTLSYKHNAPEELDCVLANISPNTGKMVLIDGVFSMEGNLARLPEIQAVSAKYKSRLAIDDAHGFGVIGRGGRGTADHFNLTDKVDLIIGTFSKTLASIGGFVAGEPKVIDFIRHFGRSMLFSASLPPSCIAAAKAALAVLKREPERVERVNANGKYMRDGLKALGYNIGISETPIVPVIIGDELLTLTLWRELLDAGVYVNAILYPATPKDKALLRTSYTSEHTREHLDKALDVFGRLKKKHGF